MTPLATPFRPPYLLQPHHTWATCGGFSLSTNARLPTCRSLCRTSIWRDTTHLISKSNMVLDHKRIQKVTKQHPFGKDNNGSLWKVIRHDPPHGLTCSSLVVPNLVLGVSWFISWERREQQSSDPDTRRLKVQQQQTRPLGTKEADPWAKESRIWSFSPDVAALDKRPIQWRIWRLKRAKNLDHPGTRRNHFKNSVVGKGFRISCLQSIQLHQTTDLRQAKSGLSAVTSSASVPWTLQKRGFAAGFAATNHKKPVIYASNGEKRYRH